MHVYTCIIRFMHDTAKRSAIQGLSQKRSVRAVVFDYGNVLCLEQTLEDMKGMALVCVEKTASRVESRFDIPVPSYGRCRQSSSPYSSTNRSPGRMESD